MAQPILNVDDPDPSGVFAFGAYYPWGAHARSGGTRENYDARSGRLLDLKERNVSAITFFLAEIAPVLALDVAVTIVPSHNPLRTWTGVRDIAVRLAVGTRIDATGCLVRRKAISKLSTQGDRSVAVHAESIVVEKPELIAGRRVLLLDDVTTTGNSMAACRQILAGAGAAEIKCAALCRTVQGTLW